MIWSEKNVDTGIIKSGSPYIHKFVYEGNIAIKNIKPICGSCTEYVWKDNVLTVKLTIKLPKNKEEHFFTKTIVIRYYNDETDFLILKGKVRK